MPSPSNPFLDALRAALAQLAPGVQLPAIGAEDLDQVVTGLVAEPSPVASPVPGPQHKSNHLAAGGLQQEPAIAKPSVDPGQPLDSPQLLAEGGEVDPKAEQQRQIEEKIARIRAQLGPRLAQVQDLVKQLATTQPSIYSGRDPEVSVPEEHLVNAMVQQGVVTDRESWDKPFKILRAMTNTGDLSRIERWEGPLGQQVRKFHYELPPDLKAQTLAEGGPTKEKIRQLFAQTYPDLAGQPAAPAPAQSQDLAALVAQAVQLHAGDVNQAPLHKVRAHLASQGIADRAQQDAAIQAARRRGLVTGSALEGRHGITPEEQAAALHEPDPMGGLGSRLGFLSLLAAGGQVQTSGPPDQYPPLQQQQEPIDLNVLAAGGTAAAAPAAPAQGSPMWAPQGTDTQPAAVPPGSFVVNADSAAANAQVLDQLGAATVPNEPGHVTAFADQAAAAPAMLTPSERVVPPAEASAHPDLVQAINAAHGPAGVDPMPEFHAGGGSVGGATYAADGALIGGGSTTTGGPVPVTIAGPLPVPVTLVSGQPTGAGPAGAAAGPQLPGVLGTLQTYVGTVLGGFKDIGRILADVGSRATGVFAGLSASLTGLAAAASPALFQTFTQSGQLLAASLGQALVPAVVRISFALQEAARWVRQLDPALKQSIGSFAVFGTAALGGIAILSKLNSIVTGVLPLLGGLKAALAFTVSNPLGGLIAGLGALAAFHPEAFAGIGQAISDAFKGVNIAGIMSGLAAAVKVFADAAAVVLVPALNLAAGMIRVLSGLLEGIGSLFGASGGQVLGFGAAFVLLIGPLRAAIAAIGAIGPAVAGMTSAMTAAGGASGILKGSLTWLLGGGLPVAIAAATAALLGMGSGFDSVGAKAKGAHAAIQAALNEFKRLEEGGKVGLKDLGLNQEQEKALKEAKTVEERRKVLEEAKAREEKRLVELDPEAQRKKAAVIRQVLEEEPDFSKASWFTTGDTEAQKGASARFHTIIEKLKAAGFSKDDAEKEANAIWEAWGKSGRFTQGNNPALGARRLTGEEVEKMSQFPTEGVTSQELKIKRLERAIEQGGVDTRLDKLQALNQKFGVAFQNEMQPQRINVEDVHSFIQNASLRQNPIEREILEAQRETNHILREMAMKQLEALRETKNIPRLKP